MEENKELLKEEAELAEKSSEEITAFLPINLKKRFFHILGIDVILDMNLNPQILELNDRPSLCVTVPFEKDLKEGLIKDLFYHVGPSGECWGDCPESGWHQIYPLPEAHPLFNQWKEIYAIAKKPKGNGEIEPPAMLPRVHMSTEPRTPLFPEIKLKKKKSKKGKKKKRSQNQ